jgi:hypothetical protein
MEMAMSDKQRTNDAQVIAQMQQHIAKKVYEDEPQGDMFLISTNMSNIIEYALAERRERMRLTAEVERLRAACRGVPEMLDSFGCDPSWTNGESELLYTKADALRAALESEVDHE